MISAFFQNKLSQLALDKVVQVSNNLSINPNWLLAVMYFESGKTFSPSKTNSIGSVGLIQFTRDKSGVNYKTINGKIYLLSDIARMSFLSQMDLVQEYYKEIIRITKKTPDSFVDTYLVTFFPAAIGKDDDFIFQTKSLSASLIAKQNPIFAVNGSIKKSNVTSMFQKWYGSTFDQINIKKKVLIQCPQCQNFF
jgi:hypothetical protein